MPFNVGIGRIVVFDMFFSECGLTTMRLICVEEFIRNLNIAVFCSLQKRNEISQPVQMSALK